MGGAIRSLPKCYCRRVFILILVLCGTQKQDFTRLMRLVEQVADREEVIIQAGHNHYETDKMKYLVLFLMMKWKNYINKPV